MLVKLLKNELYKKCLEFIELRQETVDEIIKVNREGLASETKSSAGDKHETGRAMMQLEIEKASRQISEIEQINKTLAKVNIEIDSDVVRLGSIVFTSQLNYYLAISAGEISVNTKKYVAVSTMSPIGKLLLGKKVGDTIIFKQEIIILNIQ
jgi:transcription elongation GreA/GreB family factor